MIRDFQNAISRFFTIQKTGLLHSFIAQHYVLSHRENRDQHEVLMHHADAMADRIHGGSACHLLAVHPDLPFIRLVKAVENVHQG